ncbi:MAG TPA: ATP synthase F0 subunit B [Coleofasciculaceae cyanobacterium]|jgi:cell division septum initiation protein DivIVA
MFRRKARERREAINNFAKMIERMEDLILTGMGVPFTPLTVVNGEKLVPLLDRIRENLPAEIQQAQRVLERRDDIVSDAQTKANQILQDAKKQSEFMLSDSELLRAVHDEANRIRQQITMELEAMRKKAFEEAEAVKAQAFEEAKAIREGSDQYAEAILGSLDKSLVEFQSVVRNGQRYLKKARHDAMQQIAAQQQPPAVRTGYAPYQSPQQEHAYGEASYSSVPGSHQQAEPGSYAQEFLRQTTLTHY